MVPGVLVLAWWLFLAKGPGAGQHQISLVEVKSTLPGQAEPLLTASGYVVPQTKAAVASKGQGQLLELLVVEGDRVEQGQLLARLDARDIHARLRQGQAQLKQTQAQLEAERAEMQRAIKQTARLEILVAKAMAGQSELDEALAAEEASVARLAALEAACGAGAAAVDLARVELSNMEIRAPFAGTVLSKNADVGEMVAPFAGAANSRGAVVTIADMSSLQLEADVSEAYIQRVQLGQACEVVLDAYPQRRYRGAVNRIVPTANRSKATILVKIRFLELDEAVLPEMSAKVYFSQPGAEASSDQAALLAIPRSAVVTESGVSAVWMVSNDTLQRRAVTLGRSLGALVEVITGVSLGEKIVAAPQAEFREGDPVRLP
jgi:RND family efflux transporter MFP subunit